MATYYTQTSKQNLLGHSDKINDRTFVRTKLVTRANLIIRYFVRIRQLLLGHVGWHCWTLGRSRWHAVWQGDIQWDKMTYSETIWHTVRQDDVQCDKMTYGMTRWHSVTRWHTVRQYDIRYDIGDRSLNWLEYQQTHHPQMSTHSQHSDQML